eukprot:scaffold94855_cov31-Phaeocystis_antarctica.AAC.1
MSLSTKASFFFSPLSSFFLFFFSSSFAQAHVEAPHLDREPDAQARARHGRLLRGAAAARLARPRGPHGLLAAASSDALVLGVA